MARMTEEEADRLDELWTKTTPKIDTTKPGYFTKHMAHLIEVDTVSAAYLRARADATHKTPYSNNRRNGTRTDGCCKVNSVRFIFGNNY